MIKKLSTLTKASQKKLAKAMSDDDLYTMATCDPKDYSMLEIQMINKYGFKVIEC